MKCKIRGTTILVPADQVHELRLSLAAIGLPSGGDLGFELFDEQRFGESEFSEQVKYHRALEGELARTISHLSGVERARVHLVLPSRSLFVTRDTNASGSVALHLRAGRRLDENQVRGIVPPRRFERSRAHARRCNYRRRGRKEFSRRYTTWRADNGRTQLSGTSRKGKRTSGSRAPRREFRTRSGLLYVLPPTLVSRGKSTQKKNSYRRKVAPRSFQITEERDGNQSARAEGIPGAASNLPGGEPAQTAENQQGLVRRAETRNFEISKTTRHAFIPVGRVERLQVAVVVDGIWEGEGADRSFTPRDEEELTRLKTIVSRAVGIVSERGDQIDVSCVPFAEREPIPADPVDELMGPYSQWRPYLPYALWIPGGIIALLLLRRIRKSIKALTKSASSKAAKKNKALFDQRRSGRGITELFHEFTSTSPIGNQGAFAKVPMKSAPNFFAINPTTQFLFFPPNLRPKIRCVQHESCVGGLGDMNQDGESEKKNHGGLKVKR